MNPGNVCKIIMSSSILIESIIIVHDLCSSFESMKKLSDLIVTNGRICCIKSFWHHIVIVSMSS